MERLKNNQRLIRGLVFTGFFVSYLFLMFLEFFPHQISLQVGQVSPETIKAPRSIVFEDKAKTEEAREKARSQVPKVYLINPETNGAILGEVNNFFLNIEKILKQSLPQKQKEKLITAEVPFTLPAGMAYDLAGITVERWKACGRAATEILGELLKKEITPENFTEIKATLPDKVSRYNLSYPEKEVLLLSLNYYLRPNAVYDPEATEKLRDRAAQAVPKVWVSVKQNQKIIGEGEIVTPEHLAKLEALGLLKPKPSFRNFIGAVFIILFTMLTPLFYLYQQRREVFNNLNLLVLLGIISFFILALAKSILAINVGAFPEMTPLVGYAVPLGAATMLIAILIDFNLSLLMTAILALLIGIGTELNLKMSVVAFFSGLAGGFGVSHLSQRKDLARAGLNIGIVATIAILALELIDKTSLSTAFLAALVLGPINGILAAVFTNGFLPYLETTFKVTSAVTLLELATPSHPLLKKLLMEAPGTYHHSLLVGNLAEAAAEKVNADSLLARVGAFYHDIGKLKRPYFFVENQFGSTNPHEKLTPNLSTLIVTSHIKDGVELAREYKLPAVVVDIIEQHHGTSILKFFFQKAIEINGSEVKDEDFRYPGPKPKTKEAALVMLADSVEAAVRSLKSPTPGRIEGLVRKVIKDKLLDGQLDESNLTFQDLHNIAQAFDKVLSGIFHNRVEYPDINPEALRKEKKS
ncbi:HD family phosphohydrolase [Carboxydothermus pertinax]|nr:HDIG domain-containing metalloprotein [Carboxydothermus pertinax]